MTPEQLAVLAFHLATGSLVNTKPVALPQKQANLRVNLIQEEALELELATATQDLVEIADALGDLLYVVYGAAVAYGIDLEPVFHEIHRSNMTKMWQCDRCDYGVTKAGGQCLECDGVGFIVVKREEDNKILKPPTYSPPDLESVLTKQGFQSIHRQPLTPEEVQRIISER